MHLAIDATGVKHSGGATVLTHLVEHTLNAHQITLITLFCSPSNVRGFTLPSATKLVALEQPKADSSYLYRMLWSEHFLAQQCKLINADLLLCFTGIGHANSEIPHVTFIQQSLPFSREYISSASIQTKARLTVMKYLMRRSCLSASCVIVQTPTMQNWVLHQFQLNKSKVRIVLPNVTMPNNEKEVDQLQSPLDWGYHSLLYVGSQSPHKNVETIIKGMKELREYLPSAQLYLTWPISHPANKLDGVTCIGYLESRDDLQQAYKSAGALVMPSLVETVGLPMLEAMELQVPILAADRPYAHDICEDAACYFDPLSPTDFALVARQLLLNKEMRSNLLFKSKLLRTRRAASAKIEMNDLLIEVVGNASP